MTDTIAAISTPVGIGGISIIRISGNAAAEIADTLISPRSLKDSDSHKLILYDIHKYNDPSYLIDRGLVCVMHGPNSYTGEDVVEINSHGGYVSARLIMENLVKAGARCAEPGEFTKRAVMNGRLDLLSAEAVAGIIHANSELGLKNSADTACGKLTDRINAIRADLLTLTAHLSAAVDFPEEVEPFDDLEFISRVKNIKNSLKDLYNGSKTGKMLKDGIQTVIAGKPNVGKSSLLNAILRENRAIVTDKAGTTRDVICEYINIKGVALKLLDTAGISNSADIDAVESIGIDKSKASIKKADLVIFVIDGARGVDAEDMEIAKLLEGKRVILIINKADALTDREIPPLPCFASVFTSALRGDGIEELEEIIYEAFVSGIVNSNEVYLSTERQSNSVLRAMDGADHIIEGLTAGMPHDLMSIDLEYILSSLGEITGETVMEEVIHEIFSNFCVGK